MPFWRVRKTDRRPQWRCLDDKGLPMWMGATEHAEVFANKEKALEALADAIDKEREVMKKKPKEENSWWLKIDAQWMRAHPKGRLEPMRWENIGAVAESFLAPEEARRKAILWFGRLGKFWLGPTSGEASRAGTRGLGLGFVEDLGQAQGFSSKEALEEALAGFDDSERAGVDVFGFEIKAIEARLGVDPSEESKALARSAEERDLGRTVGTPSARKGLGRKRL